MWGLEGIGSHQSILKLRYHGKILRTPREHPRTSVNIWKHLWRSENILNTSENLCRISVIKWGHPEKKCPQRGWLSIKVTTQLKTSENSWEHWQTSKIIWYHPENNWGPIIDNLVQLEEDFNSRKTSSENSWKTVGKHWKTAENIGKHLKSSDIIFENNCGPIID